MPAKSYNHHAEPVMASVCAVHVVEGKSIFRLAGSHAEKVFAALLECGSEDVNRAARQQLKVGVASFCDTSVGTFNPFTVRHREC